MKQVHVGHICHTAEQTAQGSICVQVTLNNK